MRKPLAITIGIVAVLGIGAAGAYFYLHQRTEALVDARLASLVESGRYDALSYDSLDIAADGTITLGDVRVERDGTTTIVRSIRLTDYDVTHEQPWYLDVEVDGFHFPDGLGGFMGDADPATVAMVESMLDDGTLPLRARYRYDYVPTDGERIDSTLQAVLPDSFDLSLETTTRGIPLAAFSDPALTDPDPAASMGLITGFMTQGELPSTTLTLTDRGVLDTLMAQGGQTNGVSADDFRNLLISQARNFYLFAPQNVQGVAMQAGAELASFLEGGRTLQVALAPEFGGSLAQLQPQVMGAVFTGDFAKVVDLLNLRIETLDAIPLAQ